MIITPVETMSLEVLISGTLSLATCVGGKEDGRNKFMETVWVVFYHRSETQKKEAKVSSQHFV